MCNCCCCCQLTTKGTKSSGKPSPLPGTHCHTPQGRCDRLHSGLRFHASHSGMLAQLQQHQQQKYNATGNTNNTSGTTLTCRHSKLELQSNCGLFEGATQTELCGGQCNVDMLYSAQR